MDIARYIVEARTRVRAARLEGGLIGLVPTMGALHAGHLSLIRASRRRGDFVVVSIFVNPTQFEPGADFENYPRDQELDFRKCRQAGVGLVFAPEAAQMYPRQPVTSVRVGRLTEHLCGAGRPGHFEGVALVVAKLFNIVQPDKAYFGQKDAQQLAVIRHMARDLDFPIEIVGCPIVREGDGLALSSRNAYLTAAERGEAAALHAGLRDAAARVAEGCRDVEEVTSGIRDVLTKAGACDIDYISIVDPVTMQPLERIDNSALIALAVRIGSARLIDNKLVEPRARE